MSTINYEFWPFAAASVDAPVPRDTAQVAFLESAHAKGYEAFRFGINDFGARSKQREGCILQRGRTRWEFRLADGERRNVLAYVDDFAVAARAVKQWLDGSDAGDILDDITDHLVTPPGTTTSHIVTDDGDVNATN